MNTCQLIQSLIQYAIRHALITAEDEYVIRNQLMEAMQLYDWQACEPLTFPSIDALLDDMLQDAIQRGVIPDTAASRERFDTRLMGIVTPMPREVNRMFRALYRQSPEAATDWYDRFSQALNYVRAGRIAKDMKWKYASQFGTLDITINQSKPEKDPRDIAAAGASASVCYPKCQLCPENAGYTGNANHPARQNLRPVSVTVAGEEWQLQYSPYGYYNEHCILFNKRHTPMVINRAVFEKLFDAVEQFPHYFFGSNADLPVVGGSILSHEHFQGGRYTFAMETAPVETTFSLSGYPEVTAGIVKWPLSVIRLQSKDKNMLTDACNHILTVWRTYSDPAAEILAETNGTPHNTITPIARFKNGQFECDLVLRNNRTTADRPLGLFHPNPSLHHIKKENIGLIEVMGLAVLPSRLKAEMHTLKCEMIAGQVTESVHADWANDILRRHPEFSAECADEILQAEIGAVFEQVLADAGVFKRTPEGTKAFARLIDSLT